MTTPQMSNTANLVAAEHGASSETPTLNIPLPTGVTPARADAELAANPIARAAVLTNSVGRLAFGGDLHLAETIDLMRGTADAARGGDLGHASDVLVSQIYTLDTLTTQLMREAWKNVGEHPHAFDRYLKMAMKAQTQCRSTIEALTRLHAPREQVVRHIHVHEGGQAVVTEQLYMNGTGGSNVAYTNQPHGPAASSAALSGTNEAGHPLPISGHSGPQAMPASRRAESGSADGKSERAEARGMVERGEGT